MNADVDDILFIIAKKDSKSRTIHETLTLLKLFYHLVCQKNTFIHFILEFDDPFDALYERICQFNHQKDL